MRDTAHRKWNTESCGLRGLQLNSATKKIQRTSDITPFRLSLLVNSMGETEMILYAHVFPICGAFTSIFIQVSEYESVVLFSQKARSIVV